MWTICFLNVLFLFESDHATYLYSSTSRERVGFVSSESAAARGGDCWGWGGHVPQYSDRGDDVLHFPPKNHRKVYDLMRITDLCLLVITFTSDCTISFTVKLMQQSRKVLSMHRQHVSTVFFIFYSFVDLFIVFYVLMDSSVGLLIQYTAIHKYID